jgi:hypothetical protein
MNGCVENARRSRLEPEYELFDTGIFDNNEYFDVLVTYAKQSPTDIYIKITVTNRHSKAAELTVLPTLWFYNNRNNKLSEEPVITYRDETSVVARHERLGSYYFYVQPQAQDMLFTDNETNLLKVTGQPNKTRLRKMPSAMRVINGENRKGLRERKKGTKFSAVHKLKMAGGSTKTIYCRLTNNELETAFLPGFELLFDTRKAEADDFYASILPKGLSQDMIQIQRQAIAGLLWSKQYYYFDVERWLSTSDGITPVKLEQSAWPQPRLAAPEKPGCDPYAGQMGIPLVCGVGPGFSMHYDGGRGPGVCQAPTAADYAGMVHEARRAIAGLRMELQRCKPAGARLGRPAGIPYR